MCHLHQYSGHLFLLLLELLLVEGELITLDDVAIAPTGLSRAGAHAGQQPTAIELLSNGGIQVRFLGPTSDLGSDVLALLGTLLAVLLLAQGDSVLLQVPVTEGS